MFVDEFSARSSIIQDLKPCISDCKNYLLVYQSILMIDLLFAISFDLGITLSRMSQMPQCTKPIDARQRKLLGRHRSASLCRVERENKMAATYN